MPNTNNLRPNRYNSETGRENQKKSVRARKNKKTLAEITRRVLGTEITDKKQLTAISKVGLPVPERPTYKDFLVASIILRTVQKGRVGDLGELMEILGESPISGKSADMALLDAFLQAVKPTKEEVEALYAEEDG